MGQWVAASELYSLNVCYSPYLRPQIEGDVSFSCPMKEGAVICLPIQAKGEDTVASADFGKWMIKHIDCWFAWARHLGVGIDRMEDIILVTGTHRTRSCTNVAFPGGQRDAQASFGAKVDRRGENVTINWKPSQNRGAVLNFGPDGEVRLFAIRNLCWKTIPEMPFASSRSP